RGGPAGPPMGSRRLTWAPRGLLGDGVQKRNDPGDAPRVVSRRTRRCLLAGAGEGDRAARTCAVGGVVARRGRDAVRACGCALDRSDRDAGVIRGLELGDGGTDVRAVVGV